VKSPRSIRIDADVLEQLEKRSKPFETANQVLRRVFGLSPKRLGRPRREPEAGAQAQGGADAPLLPGQGGQP
jgi:hypothetical protein